MTIAIPYGGYWSTPFARWQGSLAHLHSLTLAAHVTRDWLKARAIEPSRFDFGVLGMTVPQKSSFYGLPWLMGEIGAAQAPGPTIAQACATGCRIVQVAAAEIRDGGATTCLAIAADRTSNGPHLYYPAPDAPGGTGQQENWVLDNFGNDPFAKVAMIETAENVAREFDISTAMQNALTMRRYQQYDDALAHDSAFLKRFMTLPFAVPDARYRKTQSTLHADEGIHPTSADGLARLKPVLPGGTVTFGGQTHPADGHAGMIITTPERARELSTNPHVAISVVSFGTARVEPAYMPKAPIPAAAKALASAGLTIADIAAIKTHNPFIVNDIAFAKSFGIDAMAMNNYGSSLVWGHPQGPTGLRAIIELIEELALRGGGYGLFTGCAAGDSAMACIIKVGDAA